MGHESGDITQAWEVLQDAYQAQMEGDYERAVSSINRHWTCTPRRKRTPSWADISLQGKLEDAIAECRRADRDRSRFGIPYNDIGAYMS